jgi:NADH:ubiquinone oxidoreductase subunit H
MFSKRKYSILGSLRFCSQSIRFEIIFFFFMFIIIILFQCFVFFFNFNFFLLFYYFFFFFIIIMVELNRAPFDFSEGERELVRGFNVEFRSLLFVIIFIREYGFLIFFRVFIIYFFFFGFLFFCFFLIFFFLYIRSCFPRYRYDLLMRFF